MIRFAFYFIVILCIQSVYPGEQYVLRKVEWERDSAKINLITLRFVFDEPPNYYPLFFEEQPPVIHLDFSDTRIDSNMISVRSVPPPLATLSVLEKKLQDGGTATQVAVGVESKIPFFAKREGKCIALVLDISSALRESKVILNEQDKKQGNTVKNVSIQESKSNVEILLTFSDLPLGYSAYVLDDPPRLAVDLPNVSIDSDREEKVDVAPIITMKPVKKDNFTSLIFSLNKKVTVKTIQKGNRISLILPRDRKFLDEKKRWIYLSAGALLVGGTAVLMSGGDTKSTKAPPAGSTGDDWSSPPPTPDNIK
jgi:hypothetical protein